MNYKTLLMASAAVLFSSQAMAQDLTGAFSVPGKGQILSDTTISMGRSKDGIKGINGHMIDDSLKAAEFIEYGVNDQFSVNVGITNVFDTGSKNDYNNDHNFMYKLGAKYNMRFDDVLFQIAGSYDTVNPKDFNGHHYGENPGENGRWEKKIGLDLKAGLDLGNGITPYIVYSINSAFDIAHRPLTQSIKAGVHKYTGKWALDGAVRYQWNKNDKDPKNFTGTWFDAEADYYLKDNVALGVYGSYLIDSHDRQGALGVWHNKYDHEFGLRVKVLF